MIHFSAKIGPQQKKAVIKAASRITQINVTFLFLRNTIGKHLILSLHSLTVGGLLMSVQLELLRKSGNDHEDFILSPILEKDISPKVSYLCIL